MGTGNCSIDYFEVGGPFRGKGYGREMCEWIEECAWRMGMRRIILTPRDSAVGFWRNMGFRVLYRQTCEND
jgi:GNAT superfamily N-acetyltransferase